MSETEKLVLEPGDVLLLLKDSYPGVDIKTEYVCTYSREYDRKIGKDGISHVAGAVWKVGSTRLWRDPDWNMFEFRDGDIVGRMGNASTKHKAILEKLNALQEELIISVKDILGGDLVADLTKYTLAGVYEKWSLAFLEEELKSYKEMTDPRED